MIVYKVTNKDNGKIYIGQTIGDLELRKRCHIHAALSDTNKYKTYFSNALRKYTVDNFKWEIIRICNNVSELNVWEQYYILYFNSMNVGYNLTTGGLNHIVSETSKGKMSNTHKGMKLKIKHKKNISKSLKGTNNPMYGKHHSEDTKKKMRQQMLGKKHTKETKEKIGQGNLGKKVSNDFCYKMSEIQKGEKGYWYGKNLTNEHKKKLSIANKKYWKRKRSAK